jgi:hypothetical protein
MKQHNQSRRDFVRKAAYLAPAIVTLSVLPAHQAAGSIRGGNGGDTETESHHGGNGSHGHRVYRNPKSRNKSY